MTSSWIYSWPKTLNLDDNDDGNDVILVLFVAHDAGNDVILVLFVAQNPKPKR